MMSNTFLLHIRFWEYDFYAPVWLWLLISVPFLLIFYYYNFKNKKGVAKFSRPVSELKQIKFSFVNWIISGILILFGLGLTCLIFAAAKPYLNFNENEARNDEEGIDIIISMDVSGSMLATDFSPNRLEAAKNVAIEFIDGRTSDNIGFVVFEGEAYTACPTTKNYDYLKHVISETQTGLIEPGTAIGVGLGTAVARLRSDSIESKVIILLTDGENNRGDISPMAAAQLAKEKNIKIYTIGVGKEGYVDMPIQTPFGTIIQKTKTEIDEKLLTEMAEITGGKYFRATDENSLRSIYQIINQMETRAIISDKIKREPPYSPEYFLLFGFGFIITGLLVEQILFKKNA